MKTFAATVRDTAGATRVYRRSAVSRESLADDLRREKFLVLEIKEVQESRSSLPPLWHPSWLKIVTSFDIETALRALSSMLKSGVALLQGLSTVAEQSSSPRERAMWMRISDRVLAGGSFAEALSAEPRKFSAVVVRLSEVGERSGELALTLSRAADQLEARRNLRTAVINALMYPLVVVLSAIGVSTYLVLAVIPKIAAFLEDGGGSLPGITQSLVDISEWVSANGLYIPVWAGAAAAVYFAVRMHKSGRDIEDAAVLHIPVTGRILRLSGTALFARSMQIMTESGVTLLEALATGAGILSNARFKRRVLSAHDDVLSGASLASALEKAPEFTPMLRHMAAVGEASGALHETFGETARLHEMLLSVAVKRLGMLIEPVVIIVTGLIVGFVYIAFFTAIFAMAGVS